MRSALVTGGSGFLGRHLIDRLKADGWQVRTVGRQRVAKADEHILLDFTQQLPTIDLLKNIDTVFHLAAWQPGSGGSLFAHTLNVEVTEKLGQACAQADATRMIHISSTAAMGNAYGSPVDETSECRPSSMYERTKREAEQRLLAINGLQTAILRPPMIGGPGVTSGPLLKMFRLCQKGRFPVFGSRRDMAKPLIHVTDLVEAMVRSTEINGSNGIYLVTSGQAHELGEMLKICAELLQKENVTVQLPIQLAKAAAAVSTPLFRGIGRESPLSSARLEMYLADRRFNIARARNQLGYEPKFTNTRDILAPTYEHFRAIGLI